MLYFHIVFVCCIVILYLYVVFSYCKYMYRVFFHWYPPKSLKYNKLASSKMR